MFGLNMLLHCGSIIYLPLSISAEGSLGHPDVFAIGETIYASQISFVFYDKLNCGYLMPISVVGRASGSSLSLLLRAYTCVWPVISID